MPAPTVDSQADASSIELRDRETLSQHETSDEAAPEGSAELQVRPITKKRQMIVLGSSFLSVYLTIGINQAYGVFQNFYVNDDSPDAIIPPEQARNKALVAFVGTLAAGLTWGGSIVVNPIMARTKDLRRITIAGAVLMGIGYGAASWSTNITQLLMTQGLLYGLGSSMLYFPIVSTAPEYFTTRRGAALGFILSAAGIGGLSVSPLTSYLLSSVGPRTTLRILGLLNLVVGIPIALLTSPPRTVSRRPTLVNVRLARKPAFVLSTLAAMLQASGNYVPLTFLVQFSSALGWEASVGATLLAVSNGVNSASRIGMGALADRVGRQNTLVLSVLASCISVMALWMTAAQEGGDGKALFIAFIVIYGITAGGYNALLPTTITDVFGIQAYASINGLLYFVRGIGAMFGSPVGGAILGTETGSGPEAMSSFRNLIWYAGALLLGSSFCAAGVRGFDAMEKGKWIWRA